MNLWCYLPLRAVCDGSDSLPEVHMQVQWVHKHGIVKGNSLYTYIGVKVTFELCYYLDSAINKPCGRQSKAFDRSIRWHLWYIVYPRPFSIHCIALYNAVCPRYLAASYLQRTHKRHPIAQVINAPPVLDNRIRHVANNLFCWGNNNECLALQSSETWWNVTYVLPLSFLCSKQYFFISNHFLLESDAS